MIMLTISYQSGIKVIKMKRPSCKYIKIIFLCIISLLIVSFIIFYCIRLNSDECGEELVKALYQFQSAQELDSNMKVVKRLCDEETFSRLTIDNENRTLRTYLKFKGKPVSVDILRKDKNYVLYSINTEYIGSQRKFIFIYDTNWIGKINYVREMECIDF